MRRLCAFLLLASLALADGPPVPRKAPDFKIVEPSGRQTMLSSYRGKVILLGFFATWCSHCQDTAKVFSGLEQAFGADGLQTVGIAINQPLTQAMVSDFQRQYARNFPVGMSNFDSALGFLDISVMERWVYPQVVLIDRKGVIRAQSDPMGTPTLQEVTGLRPRIEALLKER